MAARRKGAREGSVIPDVTWAVHECGRAEFGDERLTQRFIKVVSALSEHPNASLVHATESWGEAKGVYRFFNNARVFSDRILLSHRKATVGRIRGEKIVLVAQDTTTLSFNTLRATRGLGPIGSADSRGFFLHSSLAMDVGLEFERVILRSTTGPRPHALGRGPAHSHVVSRLRKTRKCSVNTVDMWIT